MSYQDMLWNIIIFLTMIFMLSIVQIATKVKIKDNDIQEDAQYLVVMNWPDKAASDVDLWVLTPTNEKVGFQNHGKNNVNLERDDLGLHNDIIYSTKKGEPDTITYLNREVTRIRTKQDGKYVVNVQFYERKENPFTHEGDPEQMPVTIELQEIHPKYSVTYRTTVIITKEGEEKTAFSFYLKDGQATDFSEENVPFILKDLSTAVQ
jgi:uncharacterized protein YfaP (DUF2135 family)